MTPKDFWRWFSENASEIAHNSEYQNLINDLNQKVILTWPQLAWEIGPDPSGEWYFALSPNLNSHLIEQAKAAIDSAPQIPGWNFYATRQRKAWDGRFELETDKGIQKFHSAEWQFVFLRHPDGEKELVLITPDAVPLNSSDRWLAAAIVIEGMIGEKCLLDNIDSFTLETNIDARFFSQIKPIRFLPQIFGLSALTQLL